MLQRKQLDVFYQDLTSLTSMAEGLVDDLFSEVAANAQSRLFDGVMKSTDQLDQMQSIHNELSRALGTAKELVEGRDQ
jgi:hypothetical protein